jgi:hypothetical protein
MSSELSKVGELGVVHHPWIPGGKKVWNMTLSESCIAMLRKPMEIVSYLQP